MTDAQIQAMKDPGGDKRDVFTEQERAALRFTRRVTAHPGGIQQADLDEIGKHFNAEQIVELVLIIATANLTNRVNDALRTPIDV